MKGQAINMNLNILYMLIKEGKDDLSRAKDLQLKYPALVNPQALEDEETYIKHLINRYKEMGGKRNV